MFQPEYNILKVAGSPLGHKRSLIVRERVSLAKNRILSEETKKALSEFRSSRRGELNPFYGKKHTIETKAILKELILSRIKYLGSKVSVTVIDTLNNTQITYDTIKEAYLGVKGVYPGKKEILRNQKRYQILFNAAE